ncbi:MAG: hypothetical protein ACI4HI_09510 [Lachnospiraceae bacterium]
MDRIKKMILSGIEKGGIKDVADCVAAITGWYGQSEDKTVSVALLEWVLELAASGKIRI